jgi:predicted unusual protein kinase regulating ubiquinone biosynthesis (AarF/ABC1/UbiB family)
MIVNNQLFLVAGLYIYHRKKVMIQRKIDGITLEEYLSKKIRNEDFSSTGSYYSHVQKQAFNQQENIGFWHRDAHDGNIMVNAQTGEFITLIDWDNARPLRRIL